MKVLLVKKASGKNYSIEAGVHDGVKNFDHHSGVAGAEGQPSPANNPNISELKYWGIMSPSAYASEDLNDDSNVNIIEISHIDADTLLGLRRMFGLPMPPEWTNDGHVPGANLDEPSYPINLSLVEKIDLGGSSVAPSRFDETLAYMVGVGEIAKAIGFPRAGDQSIDVTNFVIQLLQKSIDELVNVGLKVIKASESSYVNCHQGLSVNGKVGLWVIGKDDPLDPSRPYQDGIQVVVVYRSHYQSVSIYCDPASEYAFSGKKVGGIVFAGHPKACGSPRGITYTVGDAQRVFEALCE